LGLGIANDQAIWDYAKMNDFTLVSEDADFAEMAALLGPPPKVIWIRVGNRPTAVVAMLLRDRVSTINAFESDDTARCLEIY